MSMRCLVGLFVVMLSATIMGCSLALAPSRHQTGGDVDAAATDAGPEGDAGPGHDAGPTPDAGPDHDAAPDDAGPDHDAAPDDAGSTDAGSDAGPSCPTDLVCAPAAPAGWTGPIVLVSGSGAAAAPACPGGAPATAFTTRSGLTAADATCGCSCAAPPSGTMSCGTGTLRTSGSMCLTIGSTIATFANGECRSLPGLPSSGNWTLSRPAFTSTGACAPSPATTVPPVVWDASHRACGFGTPTACGASSVCVPSRAAGQRLCVYVDGDAACPSGFPDLVSTADDATDTRGCSACTCGSVSGSCGGAVDIANGCPGTILTARVSVAGCVAASPTTGVSGTATFTASGACPPSSPAPTGGVVPTTPRTVCCAAD